MHILNAILLGPALVSATPRVYQGAHGIHQVEARGALVEKALQRMSDAEARALPSKPRCDNAQYNAHLSWPMNDLPNPSKDAAARQLNLYPRPVATSNTLTIHNYCNYDIFYWQLPNGAQGTLKPQAAFTSPVTTGNVWKASKSPNLAKVVQIEYVAAFGQIYYDISLIDCLARAANGLPTTDTIGCPGFEAGLQLGNQKAQTFQCAPGVWCDDQAYLYPNRN
ncbi:hypothetical protein ACEQ8H_002047 [Pleosporales sp. CAS-2024a]